MRIFAKLSLLAILAMTLCVPMFAQGQIPVPGRFVTWTITLNPLVAQGPYGTATYSVFMPSTVGDNRSHSTAKFMAECEYLEYSSTTVLDVFLRMPATPTPTDLKYIGHMVVENNTATLLLLSPNVPVITKGTKVIVAIHNGNTIMAGTF